MKRINLFIGIKKMYLLGLGIILSLIMILGFAQNVLANEETIKITQVRSTTMILEYAGTKFLIDPMLADKGTMEPFGSYPRDDKNPLNDLTVDINTLLNVDAVLVTHLHIDHFDQEAARLIPKDMPVFAQNISDQETIQSYGFENVTVLNDDTTFKNIKLIKTECQHGETVELASKVGSSCGIVLKAGKEKTVYITGDTVWYDGVKRVLEEYSPDVIIAYAGGNTLYSNNDLMLEGIDLTGFNGYLRLIMDENDVRSMHNALPSAQIVATHMESLNHWVLSRKTLQEFAEENNFADNLKIPLDGETIEY